MFRLLSQLGCRGTLELTANNEQTQLQPIGLHEGTEVCLLKIEQDPSATH